MNTLVPATEDLENRRPVWETLADMFLDTDVTLSRKWRIEQLAASPYTIRELEQILIDEVYPICKYNLLSVAGEWAGFDPDWLEDSILNRLRSPSRKFHWFNTGRLSLPVSLEWRATKRGIKALRETA